MSEFSDLLSQHIHNKNIKTYPLAQYCGIDRSNMYKIINGTRKPTSLDMVQKMCSFMHLSPSETDEMKQAYEIVLVGRENYHRRYRVMQLFDTFTMNNSVTFSGSYLPDSASEEKEVTLLHSSSEVHRALLYAMHLESKQADGYIRLLIQPDSELVMSLLRSIAYAAPDTKIDHIICLNNFNAQTELTEDYNLNCLEQVLPMYGMADNYNCYYYYDNILSKKGVFSLLPFAVVTNRHACLISADLKHGYMTCSQETVLMFQNIFVTYMENVSPFLERTLGPIDLIERIPEPPVTDMTQYGFQMSPCVTPYITMDIIKKYVLPDLPNRDEAIAMFDMRIQQIRQFYMSKNIVHYFSLDGVKEFLKTGRFHEVPGNIYSPISYGERINILKQFIKDCVKGNYRMFRRNIGHSGNEIFMIIDRQKGYLMFTSSVSNKFVNLYLEETDMLFAFYDFCENLDDRLFYTKEEMISILEKLVNDPPYT